MRKSSTDFEPDYRHILCAVRNHRPKRLPMYEHKISPVIMGRIQGDDFAEMINGDDSDQLEYFRKVCDFHKQMTYDTISFEANVTWVLPGGGALRGGKAGPIQNRSDFNAYPWDEIVKKFGEIADKQFQLIVQCLLDGMKLVGGVGNGVFEISEDLVGLEYLAYMQMDDPRLVADLHVKIGDLLVVLWCEFLRRYGDSFVVCRFGDDLGYKSGLLTTPSVIYDHVLPQYRRVRVLSVIQEAGKLFLWHSCGNIFQIMEAVISIGINARHSNEDAIAEYDHWIDRYGDRIGLFGGIDVDIKPDDIFHLVTERGQYYRNKSKGYTLVSGDSIPDYVPVEGYLSMVEAAKKIRRDELKSSD